MEKITQISLGASVFALEESAYETLKKYLDDIKAAFANETSGQEIVKDIEARVAEHLRELGKTPITAADVEDIEKVMGSVAEVTGKKDERASEPETTPVQNTESIPHFRKKLYRDEECAILGGVCAGIAAYLDADPTIVRLVAILLAFISMGTMIVIYIVLWLIVPPAITTAEKIEMHGDTATLRNIADSIHARIDELKERGGKSARQIRHEAKRMAKQAKWAAKRAKWEAKWSTDRATTEGTETSSKETPHEFDPNCEHCEKNVEKALERKLEEKIHRGATTLGDIIRRCCHVIGAIIRVCVGLAITAAGILLVVGAAAGAARFLASWQYPDALAFLALPHVSVLVGIWIFSTAVLLIIPAMFMILGGMALIRRKPLFTVRYGVAIFGIWMLALVVTTGLTAFGATRFNHFLDTQHQARMLRVEGVSVSTTTPPLSTTTIQK